MPAVPAALLALLLLATPDAGAPSGPPAADARHGGARGRRRGDAGRARRRAHRAHARRWRNCAPATSRRRRRCSPRPSSTIRQTRATRPTTGSRSGDSAAARRRRRCCAARSRRIRDASTRGSTWPRSTPTIRRAGSGATPSSRSSRRGSTRSRKTRSGASTCVLGIANFERAIGRTAAARDRASSRCSRSMPTSRCRARSASACSICSTRLRSTIARTRSTTGRGPRSRAPTLAQAAGAARASTPGTPMTRSRSPRRSPGATRPGRARWCCAARALEAAGRVDEAARDLEIAVNLAPSDAVAWRTLGKILAQHGGALEAERADDALRNALTLEPGWTDLRDAARQARASGAQSATPPPDARSCDGAVGHRARPLSAGRGMDSRRRSGRARPRAARSSAADSPGFVAAAVSSYAMTGRLPPATLEALKNDGPGLWALAAGVRKLRPDAVRSRRAPTTSTRWCGPLIDRAVALDVQEARFARAIARAAAGDRAGALADLTAYIAREPTPDHLAEARALRAEIEDRAGPRGDSRPSPQLLARIRLLEDKPEAALRALGGSCTREIPADRLVALGLVNEYAEPAAPRRASAMSWPQPRAAPPAPPVSCAPRTSTRACPTPSSRKVGSPHARGRLRRARHRRRRVGARAARGGRRAIGRRRSRARSARWRWRSATRPTATAG